MLGYDARQLHKADADHSHMHYITIYAVRISMLMADNRCMQTKTLVSKCNNSASFESSNIQKRAVRAADVLGNLAATSGLSV